MTVGVAAAALGAAIRPPVAAVEATLSAAGAANAVRSSAPLAGPPALPDVPWLAQRGDGLWVYGRGEHGPVRRLPDGETGLAIDPDRVASVVAGAGGRSTVRFRDRASGRVVRDVAAPIWVSAGAWTTAGLVVTGYGDRSMASDGGLVLVGPDGATTILVAPSPFSARLGQPVARGDVLVSPSGATVAANVCGIELCDLQVVDVATRVVSRPIDHGRGFLRAVTDDAAITTDDAGAWISSRASQDGTERWRIKNRSLIDPVTLGDGSVVGLVGSTRAGWAIAAIDRTGAGRDLTSRGRGDDGPLRIWKAFSQGATVVLGPSSFEDALDRGRPVSVSLVSAADGHPVKAAVHLPPTSESVP